MEYLLWNTTTKMWRMSEMIGFTEEIEFAGVFKEDYLWKKTGVFCNRTGDYAHNILVNAKSFDICDFETKVINLSRETKKAFKKAISIELKRKGLPIEVVIKDGKQYCPYCRREIKRLVNVGSNTFCKNCLKPVKEYREW